METKARHTSKKRALKITDLPDLNFSYIENLTDDTGIKQHSIFSIHGRQEGYCLNDSARALLLSVLACKHTRDSKTQLQLLQFI